MKVKTEDLRGELQNYINEHISVARKLLDLNIFLLNYKAGTDVWSALEAIEHLNLYGDFYIPEIRKRIEENKFRPAAPYFKSSILGNYFVKTVMPKDKLNAMKTFKSMNPNGSKLDRSVIEKFIAEQKEMLQLLEFAQKVNWSKTKTSISISKVLKLRLGDTFRVCVYHDKRHIQQAERAVLEAERAVKTEKL
jgi:hypothetical protein